jgi:hypothetical protein
MEIGERIREVLVEFCIGTTFRSKHCIAETLAGEILRLRDRVEAERVVNVELHDQNRRLRRDQPEANRFLQERVDTLIEQSAYWRDQAGGIADPPEKFHAGQIVRIPKDPLHSRIEDLEKVNLELSQRIAKMVCNPPILVEADTYATGWNAAIDAVLDSPDICVIDPRRSAENLKK